MVMLCFGHKVPVLWPGSNLYRGLYIIGSTPKYTLYEYMTWAPTVDDINPALP